MSSFFYYNASVALVTKERIRSVVAQNVYVVKWFSRKLLLMEELSIKKNICHEIHVLNIF